MKKQVFSIIHALLFILILFTSACSSEQKDAANCVGGTIIAIVVSLATGGEGVLPSAGSALSACIPFGSDLIGDINIPQGNSTDSVHITHDKNKPTTVQNQTFSFDTYFFDTRKVGTCGGRSYFTPPSKWPSDLGFSLSVNNDTYSSQNQPDSSDTSDDAIIARSLISQYHLDFSKSISTFLNMPTLPQSSEAQSITAPFDITLQSGFASVNGGKQVPWTFPISAQQSSKLADVATVACGNGPQPTLTGPYPDAKYSSTYLGCNDSGGAKWYSIGGSPVCKQTGLQISLPAQSHYSGGEVFELNGLIPTDFRIIINANNLQSPDSCVGVGFFTSDIQEFDAFVCLSGYWEVKTVNNNTDTSSTLSSGNTSSSKSFEVNISVQHAQLNMSINGTYISSNSLGDSYVGPYSLYLDLEPNPNDSTNQYPVSAVFSNFSYEPLI